MTRERSVGSEWLGGGADGERVFNRDILDRRSVLCAVRRRQVGTN